MPEITLHGERFYYNEAGAGRPIVLVHGFPLDSRIWDDQLAGLSSQCRIIAPDLRGFGRSQSTRPFSIEDLADDLHALLSQINALPCVLGGLSMGGYITFAFATKYAADLTGLMLIDTKPEADSTDARANRAKMIQTLHAAGPRAIADAMEAKMTAPTTPAPIKAKARAIMESCSPWAIEHALLAMRDRPDYCAELPSIAVPTLILVGAEDQFSPPALAQGMHREIPRSMLVIIPAAGHLPPMEQPAKVNEAIGGFVGSLRM